MMLAIIFAGIVLAWIPDRWATACVQIAMFALGAVRARALLRPDLAAALLAAPVAIGCVQIALHTTIYAADTQMQILFWLSNLVAFALARNGSDDMMLTRILVTGSAIAIAGTVQLFTSEGHVFWLFDSGYKDLVIGPFVYRNQYAAFVELLLPMAVAAGFFNPSWRLVCFLLAGFLYASVIGSGSRAGSVLATLELLILAAFGLRNRWCDWKALSVAALACVAFVFVVGPESLLDRLRTNQAEWGGRREMTASSLAMLRARPVTGFGLGNWPLAYPGYATVDDGLFANQAHSDWLEWAVEGGVPMVLALAGFAAMILPAAIRSVWGLGIAAFFLHALVDYPSRRQGLALLFFCLCGLAAGYNKKLPRRRRSIHWTGDQD